MGYEGGPTIFIEFLEVDPDFSEILGSEPWGGK